jgi:hypothetical protein
MYVLSKKNCQNETLANRAKIRPIWSPCFAILKSASRAKKVAQCIFFPEAMPKFGGYQQGESDWANFLLLGGLFLWAFFSKIQNEHKFLGNALLGQC